MRRLAAVATLLLLVPACGDDDGGAAEVTLATGDPISAADYADTVSEICGPRLDAAEEAGYDHSADGVDQIEDLAAELAAVPPPDDRRDIAQAMVDGLVDYAEMFGYRDEDGEEFSQNQNELLVVLSVRSAGLEADCGDNEVDLSAPEPPDRETADSTACFEGELAACDRLIGTDSDLKYYGVTCGGRLYHEEANENIGCVDSFASPEPVRDQP